MDGFTLLYSYLEDGQEASLIDKDSEPSPITYPVTLHITPFGIRIKYDRNTQFNLTEPRWEKLKITLNSFIVDDGEMQSGLLNYIIPMIPITYSEDSILTIDLKSGFKLEVKLQYSPKPLRDINQFASAYREMSVDSKFQFEYFMEEYAEDFPYFFRKPCTSCKVYLFKNGELESFREESLVLDSIDKLNPYTILSDKVIYFTRLAKSFPVKKCVLKPHCTFFGVNDKDEIILQALCLDEVPPDICTLPEDLGSYKQLIYYPNILDFSPIKEQYASANLPCPYNKTVEYHL